MCTGVICFFSYQSGEETLRSSHLVSKVVFQVISQFKDMSLYDIGNIEIIVRNMAHFGLYCSLGIFVRLGLNDFLCPTSKALVMVMICAIGDEVLQLSIAGRNGEVIDVLIDVLGGGIGIFMTGIFVKNKK